MAKAYIVMVFPNHQTPEDISNFFDNYHNKLVTIAQHWKQPNTESMIRPWMYSVGNVDSTHFIILNNLDEFSERRANNQGYNTTRYEDQRSIVVAELDITQHNAVENYIKNGKNICEHIQAVYYTHQHYIFPEFLSPQVLTNEMDKIQLKQVNKNPSNPTTLKPNTPNNCIPVSQQKQEISKLSKQSETPSEKELIGAFIKIYNALRESHSTWWKKTNFVNGKKELTIEEIKKHANEKPYSRTAKAWELTQKYPNAQADNSNRISEIYNWSRQESQFKEKLKKGINHKVQRQLFKTTTMMPPQEQQIKKLFKKEEHPIGKIYNELKKV